MQIPESGKLFYFATCFAVFSLAGVSICAQETSPTPPSARSWMNQNLSPDERADSVLKQMTLEEKIDLLHGTGMAHVPNWQTPLTYLSNGGAGMTLGVPRLEIPNIYMSDAAYGVRSSGENGRYSTALPSPIGAASSWSTAAACEYGGLIGRELRAQGYNMTLGGGVNLTREPRNGRTFEYMGEDPLLAGTLVGHRIKCEQAQHVIGDIKHYALNDQETGRNIVDVHLSKRAMQESDLLAFQIGIRIGDPGAVMCSYNRIDGDYACENEYLLTDVLKKEWNFKGFVLSDWGGTHSTEKASAAGLDNEQPMGQYFGPKLKEAVKAGRVPITEIDDHAHRILRSEFLSGIVDDPVQKSVVDVERGFEIAQQIEEQSIVLLKNEKNILPLNPVSLHHVAIIGAHADVGMISGGGSEQVDPPGGNAIMPPGQGATHWQDHIWFPTSPLKALKEKLPNVHFEFNAGDDATSAADLARKSDLAIVFASQWISEGMDLPNLSLPDHQDELIEQVAEANPRTIVVLETGTAVTMPWLNKVAAVVEAWYAGSRGHIALANVLAGTVNPSGKLAMTFPRSEQDLPRPVIAPLSKEDEGSGSSAVNGSARSSSHYSVRYDEGVKVGYKWYEAEHKQPLFPFGFGLSYTTFSYSDLKTDSIKKTVSFIVKNTGKRAGTEIAQVYAVLPQQAGEPFKRLVGWQRLELSPGESKVVSVTVDSQILSIFDERKNGWQLLSGRYRILAGPSSAMTPLTGSFDLK